MGYQDTRLRVFLKLHVFDSSRRFHFTSWNFKRTRKRFVSSFTLYGIFPGRGPQYRTGLHRKAPGYPGTQVRRSGTQVLWSGYREKPHRVPRRYLSTRVPGPGSGTFFGKVSKIRHRWGTNPTRSQKDCAEYPRRSTSEPEYENQDQHTGTQVREESD